MSNGVRFVSSLEVHKETTADPNDDLIPIGDSTMDRRNHIEPIEPTYRRANIVRDPAKANSYQYIFHPAEAYSDVDWLNQHEMRYAAFLRMGVVDFARSVAGAMNRKLNDMLETGFEDINSIMRDAARRGDLAMKGQSSDTLRPPAELSEFARNELTALTNLIRNENPAIVERDVALLLSLIHQKQEHANAIVRWSTLPYNLQKFYYKENLKTAIEFSLDNICDIINRRIPFGELFSDLIAGPHRIDFVRQVSLQLKKIFYDGVGGYNRTAAEGEAIGRDIRNSLMDFRQYRSESVPLFSDYFESTSEGKPLNARLLNPI